MIDKHKMQPCTVKVNFGPFDLPIMVPPKSCLLCKNLEHYLYDSNGPYVFRCYKAIGEDGVTMDVWEVGGPQGNCDAFEPETKEDEE